MTIVYTDHELEAMTAENFGQRWVADYRNPSLADAMRVLGIVQRFGMGISIARRELRDNGQPDPDFEIRGARRGRRHRERGV